MRSVSIAVAVFCFALAGMFADGAAAETTPSPATEAPAMATPAPEAGSHCKLFNNKSKNYKYDGMCDVNYDSAADVYDITLGSGGGRYHFEGKGGMYKVETPEGPSDHKARKLESGGNTVFDWYKWQLIVSQH